MPNDSANLATSPFANLWRILRIAVIVLMAFYVLDTFWFYLLRTFPKVGQASGSVHRTRMLAIANKGGKTEYTIDAVQPEEDVPCAHSIFTHASQRPCWYVVKHANDPIPM